MTASQQIPLPSSFNLTNGQQTIPVRAPAGTEVVTTIVAINGIVQGSVSLDYTNSADSSVANGTATWISAAVTHNTASVFTDKIYAGCWVRANCTGGRANVVVNPAGAAITATTNPFIQFAQNLTPPPPASSTIIAAVPGLATDNSPAWASQAAEGGSLVPLTTTARFATPGDYLFNSLNDIFPSLSPVMFGRGAIRIVPGPNLPATTSAPGPGAPGALFRVLARTPPNPDVQAYETDIWGFNVDGSGVHQNNAVHGFRFPNPDPSKNSFDPDPNFVTNKDYVAANMHDMDITNMSGDGINVEAGRGRLHIHSVRALNCLGNGFTLGGNDKIFDGHWAGGGCGNPATGTGWSVLAGQASGFYVVTGNVWSNQNSQSATSGAIFCRAANLFMICTTELNSWCRVDGGVNYTQPGAYVGCMFHLHGVNFTSDGVGINVLNDGDSRVNACTGWTEVQGCSMLWNKYARTDNAPFGFTPGNFGGFIDGSTGTAVQYLHDVTTGGQTPCLLNVAEDYSTAPDIKPWTDLQHTVSSTTADGKGNLLVHFTAHGLQTNDVVGFYCTGTPPTNLSVGHATGGTTAGATVYYVLRVDANTFNVSLAPIWTSTTAAVGAPVLVVYGGSGTGVLTYTSLSTPPYIRNHGNLVNYQYMDAYRALFRVGAQCPSSDTTGGDLPLLGLHSHIALGIAETWDINPHYAMELGDGSGGTPPNILYGNWEFGSALQYNDFAWGSSTLTNGLLKNIPPFEPFHFLSVGGGGIASVSIVLPTDLTASYQTEIQFTGGTIGTITWSVSGSGSINANYITLPTTSPGEMTVRATYRRDANDWRVTSVTGGNSGMPMGRQDGHSPEFGTVGDYTQRTNNGFSSVVLTNNTSANLESVALSPGTYVVFGYAGFTATSAATTTSTQWGLSLTSASLPATPDESYGAEQYGAGQAISTTTFPFQTGMVMKPVSVNTTTTVYLVGRAAFSGAVSGGGTIFPLRVS